MGNKLTVQDALLKTVHATKKYVDEAVASVSGGTDVDLTDLVVTNSISIGRKEGTTIGEKSVAVGDDVTASGYASHAEGSGTTASGGGSHAEGGGTTASDAGSHAEGSSSTASGYASHAEGAFTTASGHASHAEGHYTEASGYASHAEGSNTEVSGYASHVEGHYAEASGDFSHAEGFATTASGDYSHAEGARTIASSEYQHVQGRFNIEDSTNTYAHIVGNGEEIETDEGMQTVCSNAHTLDWDGNAWFAGDVYVGGTSQDTDSKKLATEEYVDYAIGNLPVFNIPQDESSRELALCELLMPYSRTDANGVLKTYVSYTFSNGQGVYITTDRYIKVMTNDDESVRSDYRQLLYVGKLQWLNGESDNYYPFVQYIDILNGTGEIGNKRFVFTGAVDDNWNIVELSYVIKDRSIATEDYVNDNVADLQGQIDELFQNVSNGKELIASAITDKGIYASGEETFQELSDKISSLIIGAPGTTIVGYVDEENDIYISQTEVAAGSYVLKYEDQNGVLAGFDDIGNVEVE